MPLQMSREVFVTCAVTGAGDTQERSPHVPRSPEQIAQSAIAAARAGAGIVHCHVRDPQTGAPSRDPALYLEVTRRIRDSDVDVVLNLTAGMGGDLVTGPPEAPLPLAAGTDLIDARARISHLAACRPEIATLDCGSMNFGPGNQVMLNTPDMLAAMAAEMRALSIRPEIEVFDTGHLWHAARLAEEGVIDAPALVQLCMGVPWGAPDDLTTFHAMRAAVPEGWTFSAFALGAHQMPYVAASVLAGGHVRVGLEDNLWLEKGVPARNEDLVARAVTLIEAMGARVIGPAQIRARLGLAKQEPRDA